MLKLYTESMRHPRLLDPAVDYRIPYAGKTPTSVSTANNDECYRSLPVSPGPYQNTALLIVVHSRTPVPFMAVRVTGYAEHTAYATTTSDPQYVHDTVTNYDVVEICPTCVSTLSGASVFIMAVSNTWSKFSISLFHEAESFSVFALSSAEVVAYQRHPVTINQPYQEAVPQDIYIDDEFEGP